MGKMIIEKLNEILSLYKRDEERFGGFAATERLHNSAPEDYVESRTDWDTLKDHADDMYYMLSDIESIVKDCIKDL